MSAPSLIPTDAELDEIQINADVATIEDVERLIKAVRVLKAAVAATRGSRRT